MLPLLLTAGSGWKIEVTGDIADGVCRAGDETKFAIQLLKDDQTCPGETLYWKIVGDGSFQKSGRLKSEEEPSVLKFTPPYPGHFRLYVNLLGSDGKPVRQQGQTTEVNVGGAWGIIADPDKIRAVEREPEDFDAFWQAAKDELAKIPPKVISLKEVQVPTAYANKVICYDVQVECAGDTPVSGYLTMPRNAKPGSLPALVSYHGAGVRSANMPLRSAEQGFLALDINAHGLANGLPAEHYKELNKTQFTPNGVRYTRWGEDNRNQYYFRGMYLRVMQSLKYIMQRPEWNGRDLIVHGGSQGGAQVIAAAALEPRVTLAFARVPALSDLGGALAVPQRAPGWPGLFKAASPGVPDKPTVARETVYFDNVYLARRIKCEIHISTGLLDTVCPLAGVIAAYNNLPADTRKSLFITPNKAHEAPDGKIKNQRLQEVLRENSKPN